jgi:hypothetical protein
MISNSHADQQNDALFCSNVADTPCDKKGPKLWRSPCAGGISHLSADLEEEM